MPFRATGCVLPLLAFCLSTPTTRAADVEADTYAVGVAEVDITPAHPIRLNGFGFRRMESEGVNHPIHVRALSIRHADDRDPVLLMTVDVLGIPSDIRAELAKRLQAKIPSERLAITATHTHCGPMLKGANPTLFGVPIPAEHLKHIDTYTAVFLDKLEQAALAALKDPKPAKLFWGVGKVGFATNRRTKGGPTDHDLPVLLVRDAKSNAVRAVYVTYACHCVTLSHNKIGGDWAGYAAEAIKGRYPGAVGLVSVGCGADQNPSSGVTGDKVEIAQVQGRQVADEVKRLVGGYLAPIRGKPVCTLKVIDLPLADLPKREVWEAKAKRTDAIGYHARVQLARLDRKDPLATKIAYPVQTWAFGKSLAMVHLSGEVVVDYSTRLKSELDRSRLWLTAYTNVNPCYIPSERVLKEGGYEGGGAMIYYDVPVPFKTGLEAAIITEVKAQLGKEFASPIDPAKTRGVIPKSPQQSRSLLRTTGTFAVDLVAAEPLTASPVAIAFGPDGKLWAAEMLDYPSGKAGKYEPGGRVRVLEDADRDGTFDRATTFLDGLPFPTGVLPWRKGVLVCAAPDIIYAEDTNGDGKADVVKKLFSGFGTSNYQARVNSLAYGLDGWVYGSCGLFGGQIHSHKTGKTHALGDRDFRIKPDTGEIEPATGRTQQGRVRDDWGNWFGCDNSNLAWHYPLADHYLRRNPHVAPPRPNVSVPANAEAARLYPVLTPQLFQLSGPAGRATAACGIGVYRDNRLGNTAAGSVFTCEPVNLLVHRMVLKPNGATFAGTRDATEPDHDFLASSDTWFRPVQAITGPDGGLWVVDMYRFVIEHPRWIPAADLAKVDVRAGAGLGRIYRIRPAGAQPAPLPNLTALDTAGLVAALDSANGWQRDTATELLAWRNDAAAVPLLRMLAKDGKRPEARLHALVTLDRLGGLDASTVQAGLADSHRGVRRHAVRLAERFFNHPHIGAAVAKLAEDADPQVRLQVAYSLGEWPDPRAGEVLARLAQRRDADAYQLAAVVSSLSSRTFHSFVDHLDAGKLDGSPLLPQLIATAIGFGDDAVLGSLLQRVVRTTNGTYTTRQFAAVESVVDAWQRNRKDRPLPAGVAKATAAARVVALDETADTAIRVAALRLFGCEPAQRDADITKLAALLVPQSPAAVQSAAIAAFGRIPDDRAADSLLRGWTGFTPALRSQAIGVLLARGPWLDKVLVAITDGKLPASAVPAGRRQGLLTHPDLTLRARAEKAFAGAIKADRQQVIDSYRKALPPNGDPARGKAVFQKTCSACHQLDGVGHAVGPDLAALANKSPDYLLAEVFDPNRNLDNRYLEYVANTADGRTLSGLLAAESANAITLRLAEGKDVTLLRTDLERLRSSGRSLMPEGLEKDVAPAAMADLIAYLGSVARPPKQVPGNAPKLARPATGRLTLRAADCEIHGDQITFEAGFGNIGMWHGSRDHVAWRVQLDKPAEFDVYLDYACDSGAAGNAFALDGGEPSLKGKVASTGAWSKYQWVKLGTLKLPAGSQRLTFRPDAEPVRGALLDLRTLLLVPMGEKPNFPGGAGQQPPP